jgi:outer membrane protein assembly factor BamB
LASNAEGVLNIINKKPQESERAVSLHVPVVSATIKNGIVAYILNNNAFGIYEIANNKKVIESRSERTFAIDTRAASPMFVDNLVVMPMLDGKLIIVNAKNTDNTKVVYVSSDKSFNNIIHLSRRGNIMVAATPTKLITLGTNGKQEYNANISEIAVDPNRIYLFTKEGKITALNKSLKDVSQTRYRYAHYAAAVAQNEKVYALDQQGSLIVMNTGLDKKKIYELGEVKEPAFITGTKLYKDGKVIELSKLGYE